MITDTILHEHAHVVAPEPPISNGRLAMMLFISSEAMMFAGLVTGYVVLGFGSDDFAGMRVLPLGLVPYATLVLVASSAALIAAQRAARVTHTGTSRNAIGRWTLIALLLGILFLGLQAVEWTHLIGSGILPGTGVNSGMVYTIGGMHGLHVIGGLVILAMLATRAMRAPASRKTRGFVTVAALYWHFVTLIWVTLFSMMYIL
jgi:cytochrome c oxidase subunit 3